MSSGLPQVATGATTPPAVQYDVLPGAAGADIDKATSVWTASGFGNLSDEQQRARFRWFYLDNPQGVGEISFLTRADHDESLGFLGVGARDWTIDGEALRAGVLVDFVVHPDHRTAAPALMLQRRGRERAGAWADVLTGLPDTKAVAVFRRLGSQFSSQLPRYVRVLRYAGYLRRHMPAALADVLGIAVDGVDRLATRLQRLSTSSYGEWVSSFDARFDELWARVDKRGRSLGVRNARVLTWRFLQQPGHDYRIFAVSRGNELRMYFVCEMVGDTLSIKDFLAQDSEAEMRYGLLMISAAARRLGAAAVSIQVCGDEVLARALKRSQFVVRESRPFFAMLSERMRAKAGTLAWYITQADEDI